MFQFKENIKARLNRGLLGVLPILAVVILSCSAIREPGKQEVQASITHYEAPTIPLYEKWKNYPLKSIHIKDDFAHFASVVKRQNEIHFFNDDFSKQAYQIYIKKLNGQLELTDKTKIFSADNLELSLDDSILSGNPSAGYFIYDFIKKNALSDEKKTIELSEWEIFELYVNSLLEALNNDSMFYLVTENLENKKQKQEAQFQLKLASIKEDIHTFGLVCLHNFYADFVYYKTNPGNDANVSNDMKQALQEFNDKKINYLVIDLRGNPGGALIEVIKIISFFIEKNPIFQVEEALEKKVIYSTESIALFKNPLLILVDKNTSSGSEIFAAAIQDHHRGLIIGETTAGITAVRSPTTLSKGVLLLTLAKLSRFDGTPIQGIGITPDLALSDARSNKNDKKHSEKFPDLKIDLKKIYQAADICLRE